MNAVLILTRNCLELTKQCVESVRGQDLLSPPSILAVDNGSTDGTSNWLPDNRDPDSDFHAMRFQSNSGVSKGWNWGLDYWFRNIGADHVLVLNNDTILPPWFYSRLLRYNSGFVTGVAVDQMPTIEPPFDPLDLSPHPDFSAFLIRREWWERIGQFDERMKLYCSDCDYHIRAHRMGLPLVKSNSPYFHINSQTMKRATGAEREEIQAQADRDREVFRGIYGCLPGTKEYYELFK
jgi:GT2 family glycosyltransferase